MGPAPSKRASRRVQVPPSGPRESLPLRLCVAGGALGLEIYEPLELAPLVIDDLAWSLPKLRFPVDLSGGVDVFRHYRGVLTRLGVAAPLPNLTAYARPRLRDALGRALAPPLLWPLASGAGLGLGLVGEHGALALDLLWAPTARDARWVVSNARGSGGIRVPLAQALRVAETLLGGIATRRGRIITSPDVGRALCRRLAPALGARTPDASSISIDELVVNADQLSVTLRAGIAAPALSVDAVRALELARLTEAADDALASGDAERARAGYVAALDKAPRHPELAALVADIDAGHADRAEAALGMLIDCMPATRFGATGALLLARTGDVAGARQAINEAAAAEVFAPVAAGLWAQLAEVSRVPSERRDALDRAVACAPGLTSVRWARFEARVEWGDEAGALSDAESLEAGASGARQRHATLCRAARQLVERGFVQAAGHLYERALRYVPDDAAATSGLGRALAGAGKKERAMALFERAIELAEAQNTIDADALIDLARLLAEGGDHPQAIARLSQVPAACARGLEALALQGRYRAALGDAQGASLTFARLRDACELQGRPKLPEAVAWLCEAAQFEQRSLGDLAAAERHLAAALRLAPRDSKVRRAYRETAGSLSRRTRSMEDSRKSRE